MSTTHQSIDAAREEARLLSQDRGEGVRIVAIRGREAGLYETCMASASAFDIRCVYGERAEVVDTVYPQSRSSAEDRTHYLDPETGESVSSADFYGER